MATMAGSAVVDPGSDDDEDIYSGLYITKGIVAAEEHAKRVTPYARYDPHSARLLPGVQIETCLNDDDVEILLGKMPTRWWQYSCG